MAKAIHPDAPHHLPFFITGPGETDGLMVGTAILLGIVVFAFGVFFFRLHSLPEHIAHKSDKMQAELVAVLCLISLFTHMHIFWIVALVVAMIELPDFGTPLNRIAGSAEKLAGIRPGDDPIDVPSHADGVKGSSEALPGTDNSTRQADGAIPMHGTPERGQSNPRGRAHV